MKLLKSQKDQIFKIIISYDLNPIQFEVDDSFKENFYTSPESTKIFFKDTDYYFLFDLKSGRHYCIYCLGNEKYFDEFDAGSFNKQLEYFNIWLSNLKRELETPDYWKRMFEEADSLKMLNYDDDLNKFNIQEFTDITVKINLLKTELNNIGLKVDDIKILESKLDRLIELAKSMNKIDWKNLLVGTILSIPVQLSLEPGISKTLFQIVKKVFSTLFLG